MVLTLMQDQSVYAEENIQSWTISGTKKAIPIKLATTAGDNKFYFSHRTQSDGEDVNGFRGMERLARDIHTHTFNNNNNNEEL